MPVDFLIADAVIICFAVVLVLVEVFIWWPRMDKHEGEDDAN